jgi:hypothetical protein
MFTRVSSVGSLTTLALAPTSPHTRATLKQPSSLAASTTGARAWRSTTRERWRRTRSLPRGVALCASGRSATCTAMAAVTGVDVDYAQALPWIEKAAAQDHPQAVVTLGVMYHEGKGVTPSFRRAREYYERSIALRCSGAVESMQNLIGSIQNVTSRRSNHPALSSSLVHDLTLPHAKTLHPHTTQVAPLMDKRV